MCIILLSARHGQRFLNLATLFSLTMCTSSVLRVMCLKDLQTQHIMLSVETGISSTCLTSQRNALVSLYRGFVTLVSYRISNSSHSLLDSSYNNHLCEP